jgi:hypothetical protein
VLVSCNEYLLAISRKKQIGQYHSNVLVNLVTHQPVVDPVPVAVQAHFEGLLMSTIASADQVAAGIQHVSGIGQERRGLDATFEDERIGSLPPELVDALRGLWFDARTLDIREVRRRASHLYYDKIGWAGSYYIPEYPINESLRLGGDLISNREILNYSTEIVSVLDELTDRGTSILTNIH